MKKNHENDLNQLKSPKAPLFAKIALQWGYDLQTSQDLKWSKRGF